MHLHKSCPLMSATASETASARAGGAVRATLPPESSRVTLQARSLDVLNNACRLSFTSHLFRYITWIPAVPSPLSKYSSLLPHPCPLSSSVCPPSSLPLQVKFMLASAQLGAPETLTDSEGVHPTPSCRGALHVRRLCVCIPFVLRQDGEMCCTRCPKCNAPTHFAPGQHEKAAAGALHALRLDTQRDRSRAAPSITYSICPLSLPPQCHPPHPPSYVAGIFRDVSASFWVQPGHECQVRSPLPPLSAAAPHIFSPVLRHRRRSELRQLQRNTHGGCPVGCIKASGSQSELLSHCCLSKLLNSFETTAGCGLMFEFQSCSSLRNQNSVQSHLIIIYRSS
jgi:hypothetical protein